MPPAKCREYAANADILLPRHPLRMAQNQPRCGEAENTAFSRRLCNMLCLLGLRISSPETRRSRGGKRTGKWCFWHVFRRKKAQGLAERPTPFPPTRHALPADAPRGGGFFLPSHPVPGRCFIKTSPFRVRMRRVKKKAKPPVFRQNVMRESRRNRGRHRPEASAIPSGTRASGRGGRGRASRRRCRPPGRRTGGSPRATGRRGRRRASRRCRRT